MGWARSFLRWGKGPKKRNNRAPSGRPGTTYSWSTLRSYHRGLRCEPLEPRRLLSLGTYALVEGPTAGSDSNVVTLAGAWTAAANASWLHTSSSGTGNGLAKFTFDANAGATRSGTLSIAGSTLTVTQVGSGYVAANPVTTLVSSGLNFPVGVAVDASGNLYIADSNHNAIKEWNAGTQTVSTVADIYPSAPNGVAVDSSGNIYLIADPSNLEEWNASTQTLSTLASSGLFSPAGLAVNASGNVYIADPGGAVEEWSAATNTVSKLVSSGLVEPSDVAVDACGNVYIADWRADAIKEWNAATKTLSTLVSSGLNDPEGVAVDASGNVYIADTGNNAVKEWNAAAQTVSTFVSTGLASPYAVAVDASGNVYIADTGNNAIKELSRAFVPSGAVSVGMAAGNGSLSAVLPAGESLAGVFVPTSNESWLTIDGVSNGVVEFSFTADSGASRTADITLLGQQIAVTQAPALGTYTLLEGPAAGSDSVVVEDTVAWTAAANASWLSTSSSGAGNGVATLSFTQNTGATRTGTLTIAGSTLTVTQAGGNYVAASPPTTLVNTISAGALAVDASGNVYIADSNDNAVKEWNAATQTVTTLVSSGLFHPSGVAVDAAGNVYIADTNDNAVKEWNAATQTVSTLVSSGSSALFDVAVDASGNVYIADSDDDALKEWNPLTQTVSTLVSSGLSSIAGVAVDAAGNVYMADTAANSVDEWNAASQTFGTLVSSGLDRPYGVAVDGSGNVYIADGYDSAVKEWNAASHAVITLISTGLSRPVGVAVDASGNVYVADVFTGDLNELPRTFVSSVPLSEGASAGSGALPAVLPTSASLAGIYAPTSDQTWLTIGSVSAGVVDFSFTANTGTAARTADVTVLGQQIAVTQAPALATGALVEGPAAGGDSDPVAISGAWTTTSNASWLHITSSGSGNGLATFTFDANTGATRTGTMTVANENPHRNAGRRRLRGDECLDHPRVLGPELAGGRGRGRFRQRVHRQRTGQHDQRVEPLDADDDHAGFLRTEGPAQPGRGRIGERLPRRVRGRLADCALGMECRGEDLDHAGLVGPG